MYLLAHILYGIGFFFRNNLVLRVALVLASLIELVFLTYMSRKIDVTMISLTTLFIIANGIHLVHYINQTLGINLNQKQIQLKEELFDFMEFGDFKHLMSHAKWNLLKPEEYIIEQGKNIDKLYLITDGEVDIYNGDKKVNTIKRGNFLGEISFFKGEKTSADAITKTEVEYIYWDKTVLLEAMQENDKVETALYAVVNKDLMSKLTHSK